MRRIWVLALLFLLTACSPSPPTPASAPSATGSAVDQAVALWPGQTILDLEGTPQMSPARRGPVVGARAFAIDALGWSADLPASPPMDPNAGTLPITVGRGRCGTRVCPWTQPYAVVAMSLLTPDGPSVSGPPDSVWAVRQVGSDHLRTSLSAGDTLRPGDVINVSVFTYSTAGGIQRHDRSVTVPESRCTPIDLGTFTEHLRGTAYPMRAGMALGPDCGRSGPGWVSVFLLPGEAFHRPIAPARLAPPGVVTLAAVPVVFAPASP
jgi:hypothetical protein